MENNILSTIHGEHVAAASQKLPDPATAAPDELREVEMQLPDGRLVRITYKPFCHKQRKNIRYFWTAEHAELI